MTEEAGKVVRAGVGFKFPKETRTSDRDTIKAGCRDRSSFDLLLPGPRQ